MKSSYTTTIWTPTSGFQRFVKRGIHCRHLMVSWINLMNNFWNNWRIGMNMHSNSDSMFELNFQFDTKSIHHMRKKNIPICKVIFNNMNPYSMYRRKKAQNRTMVYNWKWNQKFFVFFSDQFHFAFWSFSFSSTKTYWKMN